MRQLRVAMVHGAADPTRDGVADYLYRLVGALSAVRVEVAPVMVCPRAGAGDRFEAADWWRAAWRAAAGVRMLRPDLVHVQFAPSAYRFTGAAGLLPLLVGRGVPLVTTLHEYGRPGGPRWWERASGWDRDSGRLVRDSRAVVVTNAGHAAELRERTGRAPVLVPIAPNVSDAGATDRAAALRARWGVPPDARLIAFFGFVHPVKGLRYLLAALPELRRRHPTLHTLVIGGFTSQALPREQAEAYRADLAALAVRQGVADAITFTGYLPAADVSAALHACEAAVLPFGEGVTTKSGALLTTLAHRLPTAVTVPYRPDPDLVDGATVAVIPRRRDVAAVTAAVDRLLRDGNLRRRLADGGARLVAGRRWCDVATAHRDLYDMLLDLEPARDAAG
ncbi:glycosyltransferase [Rhizomonospora bruguierae]|uniref:glycosyltransferase n=1 Tax=Rhizomonospora bruguierae TaxID=1581705 RepID=UPI001BCF94F7|nr:glycosyltransferase [Micromonospora sp. NBRC 107566]